MSQKYEIISNWQKTSHYFGAIVFLATIWRHEEMLRATSAQCGSNIYHLGKWEGLILMPFSVILISLED